MIIKPKYYGPAIPSTYAITMTAAASGSNGITVADDDDIDFGTGDFFLHWEGSLPDWTPASNVTFLPQKYLNTSNPGYTSLFTSSGTFEVRLRGPAGVTVLSGATSSIGPVDGKMVQLTAVVVRETASIDGSYTLYLNGTQVGSPLVISASTPGSLNNSYPLYIAGTSTTRTASNTISCIVGNFAPSAAEVLDLCKNGIPESWKWGSQAAFYTSNFSAGTDGWNATRGSASGNVDSIGGENDWLRLTVDSTNASHNLTKSIFTAGNKYHVSIRYFIPSGQSNVDGLIVWDSNGAISSTQSITGTATTFEFQFTATSANMIIYASDGGNLIFQDAGADDVLYTKDIVIKRLGATMALLPNSIPTSGASAWDDSSGNTGGGTLPAAGATKVTIRR